MNKVKKITIKVLAFPVKVFIIIISGIFTGTVSFMSDFKKEIKDWQDTKYNDPKFTNKQIKP